ncbi:MAG: bifunctional sulfate adenylyltransferase/adenylylsulfate kinase [Deltaproteobacteria bacterium]|nr:bifunctional sulfate adenylyltransferase/adenylylsulfate kinase [Deltaproteobacteria bacterium]
MNSSNPKNSLNRVTRPNPHGGKLIDLVVDEERASVLRELAFSLPDITLNGRQLCDLELLAVGAFSPLEGFMCRSDYESVLDRMRLQDGLLWPMPVCLDVSATQSQSLETGQSVTLRDPEGFLLAVMHIEDMWPVAREKEADRVYGTRDQKHPGVHHLYTALGDVYLGGRLEVLSLPLHFDYKQLRLSPVETRSVFNRLGWKRVVGFQTRSPIQRPQFEMTMRAMRAAKANILIHPVVGMTKPGDFDHYTRVRCYKAVTEQYPPDSFLLNLLPLAMRMAGPREAMWHAIVSKNYGCSHFIVGPDHAGPGNNGDAVGFYEANEATVLTAAHSDELGIGIVPFEELVYLPFEDEYRTKDTVPEGVQTISLSGSDIQQRIRTGKRIPDWATFPEVMAVLRKAYPPPNEQGFTVFMTGLSGAGKSTVAKVLYSRFQEIGKRPVTLLDGDIVRQNLSSQLSFSKEDRDTNVRRIGFVAAEITKNRGIAICAPIAPYKTTRREIRDIIEAYGGFVEVHISTSLEECEKRDRKGMYAKARAGLIKGFTGVDDPYEVPDNPEVRVDTTGITPDEAAREVLLYLGHKGYI